MKEEEINRTLFITINKLSEIATSRVSMWSLSNRYAYAPFFRFIFKNGSSILYNYLERKISSFNGNFKWVMERNSVSNSSYIIAPSNYIQRLLDSNVGYHKKDFLNEMNINEYKKMIDKVIEDVPLLAFHILENSIAFDGT